MAESRIDNRCQAAQVALIGRQTMSFALPESMHEYIDIRVAAGNYGNTSDYIRDLIRRDQEVQARKRLRDLIEEGLASGPGRRCKKADEKDLLALRDSGNRLQVHGHIGPCFRNQTWKRLS